MARHYKPNWQRDDRGQEQPQICSTTGKRMYDSEEEAKATAAHRMAEKEGPARLRVYRCLYCEMWHLTSKEA